MNEPNAARDYTAEVAHVVNFAVVPPIEHTPGGTLHVLHGDDMGLGEVSLLLSHNPPDGGPRGHTHPYVELFVVQDGEGVYMVGGESFPAGVGDVIVVPANVPHGFHATSDSTLTHVAIHQAAHSVSYGVE